MEQDQCDILFISILYKEYKTDASFFISPLPSHPTLGDGCTHLSISEHKTISLKTGAEFLSKQ